jgi:hypothetical protein
MAISSGASGAFAAPASNPAAKTVAVAQNPPPRSPGMSNPGAPPPPPPPGAMTPPAPPKPKIGPPGVAAMVNGEKITIAAVKDMTYQQHGSEALQTLIRTALIDQEAKKENVTATSAEIAVKIQDVKKRIESAPGRTLESELKRAHMTMDDLRKLYKGQVEMEKMAAKREKPSHMVHIRHILIYTANPAGTADIKPHTDAEAKTIAAQVESDMKAGVKWEDLVTKYSEDKQTNSKDKAGDLGVVGKTSPFDQDFMNGVMKLNPGQTSTEPIKSIYGYHFVKVESSSDTATGAEKDLYKTAMDQDKQMQLQQAEQSLMQDIQQKAKIDNFIDQ